MTTLATESPSPSMNSLADDVSVFPVPTDELHAAVRRARLRIDREGHIVDIAAEARRRQIRDGLYELDASCDDGELQVDRVFSDEGSPDGAVIAAGYDINDPTVQDAIIEGELLAEEDASGASLAGTPWGCREEEDAHRRLHAPDWKPAPAKPTPRSVGAMRPLPNRRGRERRSACNTRRRRRRTTSSSGSRGDPDLGDEPPSHRPLPNGGRP